MKLTLIALTIILIPGVLGMEVIVGVYDDPPLVSKKGKDYEEMYIDLIEEIARKEGWRMI